jgi:hypothetical protein
MQGILPSHPDIQRCAIRLSRFDFAGLIRFSQAIVWHARSCQPAHDLDRHHGQHILDLFPCAQLNPP